MSNTFIERNYPNTKYNANPTMFLLNSAGVEKFSILNLNRKQFYSFYFFLSNQINFKN